MYIIKKIVIFHLEIEEFAANFSVILNHFHAELEKPGENSNVCVVSGEKNYYTNILYVIELFLNNFAKIR